MTDELLHLICKLPLFETLSRSLVKIVLNGSLPVTIPRGQTIALQGDEADNIGIVLTGMIKVYRLYPEGKEILIRLMQGGDVILTDLGINGCCLYDETFEAIRDTQLIFVGKKHIQNCMSDHPKFAMALLTIANRQAQYLADEITLIKWQYLPQRVVSFLLELCREHTGQITVTLPYEKTVIAARLGASRESLSRTFADLKHVGVKVNHTHVTIQDVGVLKQFAMTTSHDLRSRFEK